MPAFDQLFSPHATVAFFVEYEKALARAQAGRGLIPSWAAERIDRDATIAAVDFESLARASGQVGFPVASFVRQLADACGEAGEYPHWGSPTQALLLSSRARQINTALPRLERLLARVLERLAQLAARYRDTPMAGRGFGGHALPITFGLKLSHWTVPLLRHADRLQALLARPIDGELAGAMGTLASMGAEALAVQREVLDRLGLPVPLASASSARDAVAEVVQFLALLTASLAKIAQDIAHLAWTEIGELAEPTAGTAGMSSTLPHKANPILSWQIMTGATLVQRNADAMIGAVRQEQERSGHGFIEGCVVPEAFIESHACLEKTLALLDGLRVDTRRMRRNLDATGGMIVAEAVQMALAPALGRLRAHDLVHQACADSVNQDRPLLDALLDMPAIRDTLPRDTVRQLLDPCRYLGAAGAIVDQVVRQVGTRA